MGNNSFVCNRLFYSFGNLARGLLRDIRCVARRLFKGTEKKVKAWRDRGVLNIGDIALERRRNCRATSAKFRVNFADVQKPFRWHCKRGTSVTAGAWRATDEAMGENRGPFGRFSVVASGENDRGHHVLRAGALARASAPASDLCYNGGRYEESISSP